MWDLLFARQVELLGTRVVSPFLDGIGLLLDRAVRVARDAMLRRRSGLEAAADAVPRPLLARLATARSTLASAASALAVLDPQATLERGYAIVRRAADERILRAPAEAPAGTALAIRLAAGELAATAGVLPAMAAER